MFNQAVVSRVPNRSPNWPLPSRLSSSVRRNLAGRHWRMSIARPERHGETGNSSSLHKFYCALSFNAASRSASGPPTLPGNTTYGRPGNFVSSPSSQTRSRGQTIAWFISGLTEFGKIINRLCPAGSESNILALLAKSWPITPERPAQTGDRGTVEENDEVDDQEHCRASSFGQFPEHNRATEQMDAQPRSSHWLPD